MSTPDGPAAPDGPHENGAASDDDAREVLAQLFGGDADDLDEAASPPVYWPALSADDYADQLRGMYVWAARLQHRYPEMVRLPRCWYRHNGLVELLGALRDHERAAYSDTAAPASAMSWQIAFRDCEARLRGWISELRCGGDPDYHDRTVHAASVADTETPDDLQAWIVEACELLPAAGTVNTHAG